MDPNDNTSEDDVVKFFFTSSTRKGPNSPVTSEPGCINLQLHKNSDLYIKTRENGQVYMFEVVSTIFEQASSKFENMVYCTNVRGNQEECVWSWPITRKYLSKGSTYIRRYPIKSWHTPIG